MDGWFVTREMGSRMHTDDDNKMERRRPKNEGRCRAIRLFAWRRLCLVGLKFSGHSVERIRDPKDAYFLVAIMGEVKRSARRHRLEVNATKLTFSSKSSILRSISRMALSRPL